MGENSLSSVRSTLDDPGMGMTLSLSLSVQAIASCALVMPFFSASTLTASTSLRFVGKFSGEHLGRWRAMFPAHDGEGSIVSTGLGFEENSAKGKVEGALTLGDVVVGLPVGGEDAVPKGGIGDEGDVEFLARLDDLIQLRLSSEERALDLYGDDGCDLEGRKVRKMRVRNDECRALSEEERRRTAAAFRTVAAPHSDRAM